MCGWQSTKFAANLLDATKAFAILVTDKSEMDGLSPSLLQFFSQVQCVAPLSSRPRGRKADSPNSHEQNAREDGHEESTAESGPWRVTLDPPSYVQFMKHAANRGLRERLFRASVTRASGEDSAHDNESVITELLATRRRLAALLGFDTYAAVSLSKKMAPSVAAVDEMHSDLRAKCVAMARQEVAQVEAFAQAHGQSEKLAPWDVAYWSEQLKAEQFSFTDEDVKPFFPLPKVLDGLFALTERLFGVSVEPADGQTEVWHPDVRFFHLRRDGERIASFYLDPYSRPKEKNGGAWMNECVGRSKLLGAAGGGDRLPVAYLVCNQSPPVDGAPSLMTFREVETLFHEFGHGLQHMLTRESIGDVAGISGVEWDAVELPSQMMENFCYDAGTCGALSLSVVSIRCQFTECVMTCMQTRSRPSAAT